MCNNHGSGLVPVPFWGVPVRRITVLGFRVTSLRFGGSQVKGM